MWSLVFVGEQDAVDVAHSGAEHLVAEIRACVDHEPHAPGFDHRRGAQTVVPGSADMQTRQRHPITRHALRGSGSQKGEFHGLQR